ncbi:hypothetical protein [Chitinophaga vietnamensis]|uniref:hypothetical protein n=1 Tax=Chitinophaga vietnamensis TaxID=2593957 RepID=UPI001177EE73|nr:hypothetical protein [Chitinophaga vietnamensis]
MNHQQQRSLSPFYIASAVFTLLMLFSWYRISRLTGGMFCYSLDDAFIHMAVAKNFGLHGVWGITPDAFGSASSSPLYTVLLALLFRIGVHSYLVALFINVGAAFLLLFSVNRLLEKYNMPSRARTIVLLLLIFLLPLQVLVITGMEHVLHLWFALLFLQSVAELAQATKATTRQILACSAFAALMVSARFEGLFMLGTACLLLCYYRKWRPAVIIGVIAIAPLCLFGLLSVLHGGAILPNSVLLKGSGSAGLGQRLQEILVYRLMYGNNTMMNLFQKEKLFAGIPSISGTAVVRLIVIVPLLVLLAKTKEDDKRNGGAIIMGVIFSISCILHLGLAAVGWMFRYEAYLIGLALIISSILLYQQWPVYKATIGQFGWPRRIILLALVYFVCSPLIVRTLAGYRFMHRACRNIYEQQYQMGLFLNKYYPGVTVAANDVGAVSFLSGSRIIDIWGLGNNAIAKSRLKGDYSAAWLLQFLQQEHTKIAVIYNDWYEPALYGKWTEAGSWTISDNVICGGDKVTFYALDPKDAPLLQQRLAEFKKELPQTVLAQNTLAHDQ